MTLGDARIIVAVAGLEAERWAATPASRRRQRVA
jgi:hypothetical protein